MTKNEKEMIIIVIFLSINILLAISLIATSEAYKEALQCIKKKNIIIENMEDAIRKRDELIEELESRDFIEEIDVTKEVITVAMPDGWSPLEQDLYKIRRYR